MPPKLTPVQRRVLGVLIEKSMTSTTGYPLTLNSIVTGCNQLSCREPVMKVTEAEADRAVQDLKQMKLVREPDYAGSSRVDRYAHTAQPALGGDYAMIAVMAELLLRGPQTPGELKTNASRMTPIADLEAVTKILSDFASHGLTVELARQPGRRESRHDHLLYAEPRKMEEAAPLPPPSPAPVAAPAPHPGAARAAGSDLESRVAKLEAELAALKARLGG